MNRYRIKAAFATDDEGPTTFDLTLPQEDLARAVWAALDAHPLFTEVRLAEDRSEVILP